MSGPAFSFQVHATDPRSAARASTFATPHGDVDMPAFMPVGTQATVKGLTVDALRATGTQMVLANTYHLALRPGEAVVAALGGLHALHRAGPARSLPTAAAFRSSAWRRTPGSPKKGPIFRSHLDGNLFELSPERAVAIQEALGSDVAMVLDHVVALPNDPASRARRHRAQRPLGRGAAARRSARTDQALFAIVQGGLDAQLRVDCARQLAELDFPGYAVGGLERRRGAGRDVSRFWRPPCPLCRPIGRAT